MKAIAIAVVGCVTCGMMVPIAASAQVAGERIRVTLPAGRIVGVLAETRPSQLVLALAGEGGGLRTVAHDEILRLERSLGERRQTKKGAITGALSVATFSLTIGLDMLADRTWGWSQNGDCPGEGLAVAGLVLTTGLIGAGVGALAGALRKEEPWETIEGWSSPGKGERIRVTLPAGRIVGVLAEAKPDELVLALAGKGGGLRTVEHDEIRRLERSLGERGQARKGTIYGALGGAALGTLLGLARGDYSVSLNHGYNVAGTAWAFGLLGAGAGALAGALWKREAWETIEDRDSPGMTTGLIFDVRTGQQGRRSLFIGGRLRF